MGEKDIVEGDGSTGFTGGGSTTGPGPGGDPPPRSTGGGGPRTEERPDPCRELNERAQELSKQLEGLHDVNREQTQRALRAFFGDPSSKLAGGYAHWFQQAKVTEAVVDANNAVGKTLIDVALFAMGGWGGISKIAGASKWVKGASGLSQVDETAKWAKTANKLFGSGLLGANDWVEVAGKVGIKVLEKAGDQISLNPLAAPLGVDLGEHGFKVGKLGTTVGKTIAAWDDPKKWFQAPLSGLESVIRGEILSALGGWMKKGAMAGDLGRAATAYADFFAAAMAANASAAAAAEVHRQLEELNAEAQAKGCPEVPVPDYTFYTFAPTQFGEGAFKGQAGPTMHARSLESGFERDWDLFAQGSADQRGLPFQ